MSYVHWMQLLFVLLEPMDSWLTKQEPLLVELQGLCGPAPNSNLLLQVALGSYLLKTQSQTLHCNVE